MLKNITTVPNKRRLHHLPNYICSSFCKTEKLTPTIASHIICCICNLLYETSTNVLDSVFEFNTFCNSDTVFCHLRGPKTLFQDNIAALWKSSTKNHHQKSSISTLHIRQKKQKTELASQKIFTSVSI